MESANYRKLTDDARAAIAAAIAEEDRLGHAEVGAAHLLLGLRTAGCQRVVGLLRASGMASVQRARDALRELDLPPRPTASSQNLAAELLRALDAAADDQARVSASDLCAALLSVENTATDLLDILAVDRALVVAQLRAETWEPRASTPHRTTIEDRLQHANGRSSWPPGSDGRWMMATSSWRSSTSQARTLDARSPI